MLFACTQIGVDENNPVENITEFSFDCHYCQQSATYLVGGTVPVCRVCFRVEGWDTFEDELKVSEPELQNYDADLVELVEGRSYH